MSEDLPEPINPQIPFADLEPGTIPTGLLAWSGTAWLNTLSLPVPAVVADDAKTPDVPASLTYGNLYKKPNNTGLFWATQGAGEINLLETQTSTFYDATFRILNSIDTTKRFGFDVANVQPGYTSICTVPNYPTILPAKTSTNLLLGEPTYSLTSGAQNSIIGIGAGTVTAAGGANTILGYAAGTDITSGADNVVLGANAQAGASLASNRVVLGSGAIGAQNNSLTLGSTISGIYAAGLSSATATDVLYYNTGTGQISHGVISTTNIPNTLTTQTILPAISNTYSLGSSSELWAGIYTNGLQIPTGAVAGYVWTTDNAGVGSWQIAVGIVDALYGTADQVFVNAGLGPAIGNITLTLPQSIATTSDVQFGSLVLTTPCAVSSGGTGVITIPSGSLVVGQGTSATTSVAYSATGGVSNVVARDSSGNTAANNLLIAAAVSASAGSTTVLTVASNGVQILTGTLDQIYTLPAATTLQVGHTFKFYNDSTGALTVNNDSAASLTTVSQYGSVIMVLQSNLTTAGVWSISNGVPREANWGSSTLNYTGSTRLAAGGVGTPAYSFTSSPTTGMYLYGAGQLALTANSVASLIIDATGNIVIPNNLTVNGTSTFINSSVVTITDNMILVGYQNATDAVDLGLAVEYTSSGVKYGAVYRGAGSDDWFIKNNIITTPGNTIVGGSLANLNVAQLVSTGFKLSTGAAAGYVLTSDALGVGTWTATGTIVNSIQGTANQILVNATSGTPQTGAITLTLPQSIATTSTPTFAGLTLNTATTDVQMNLAISSVAQITTGYDATNTYYYVKDPVNVRTLLSCESDAVTSHVNIPNGGLVVAGAATVVNYAQVSIYANGNASLDEINTANGLGIYSGTTPGTDMALYFGANRSAQVSYIQSRIFGTGAGPLLLNSQGGNVSIGSATATSLFNVGTAAQFQVSAGGAITAGAWQGSVIAGQYGGTGVANTGLTINLSSGAVGKVIVSDVSGNATWGTLSYAQSIQGTANQVLVNGTSGSAQTGAIILTLPQSIATTSDVQFNRLGLGVSPVLGASYYSANSLSVNFGTITGQTAQYIADTLALSIASSNAYGIFLRPSFASATGITSSVAAGIYVEPLLTSNVGTVSQAYGLYIPAGSVHTGTVSQAYGIYVATPAYGSAQTALYVSGSATVSQTIKLTALTAETMLALNASQNIVSASMGTSLTFSTNTLNTIQEITTSSSPTFNNLTLNGLTASRLVYASGANLLTSAVTGSNLTFITGTLDTVQGIQTSSSPTFVGLTLSGLTQNRILYLNNSFAAAQVTTSANLSFSAGTLDTVQGIQTSSTPQFAGLGIGLAANSGRLGISSSTAPTTALLEITNTNNVSGIYHGILTLMTGAPANSLLIGYEIGRANSTNNTAYLGLYFVSTNSASNFLSLGMFGADNILTCFPSGNVGIGLGTTAPTSRLTVSGTGSFTNVIVTGLTANTTVYSNGSKQLTSGSVSDPITFSAGAIGLNYNATNLRITSTALNTIQDISSVSDVQFAKLGLGVAPGSYVLDVYGVSRFHSTAGGDNGVYLNGTGLGTGVSGVSFGYNQTYGATAMTNAAYIQAESQGVAYRPILLNPIAGNVGIGTTSPSYLLDIRNNNGYTYCNVLNTYGDFHIGVSGGADAFIYADATNAIIGVSSNNNLSFRTNNTTYATLTNNGKFGIGTDSPQFSLDVYGYGRFYVTSGGDDGVYLNGNNLPVSKNGVTIGYNQIYAGVAMTNAAYIQAESQGVAYRSILLNPISGNVGVGATSASYTLDVAGAARATILLVGALATPNSFVSIDDTSSSLGVMLLLNSTLTTNTAASDRYGIINYGRFTYNSGATSAYATGHYAALNLTVNSGASLINAQALYIAIPSNAGVGTINNAYGIYALTPTIATNNAAIYTDNLSCGYAAASPPASGVIVSGSVGIGASSVNSSSILEVTSTTKGVRFPNMTTAQKNSISNVAGLVIFDTDLGKLCVNTGAGWQTITST